MIGGPPEMIGGTPEMIGVPPEMIGGQPEEFSVSKHYSRSLQTWTYMIAATIDSRSSSPNSQY